jgi:hypothetical protein
MSNGNKMVSDLHLLAGSLVTANEFWEEDFWIRYSSFIDVDKSDK